VGSSGGAHIGVDVALRHGHLLRGAVLSEPPLFSIDPAAGEAFMRDLVPPLEEATAAGGPRAGIDAFFSVACPGLWSSIDDTRKDRYRNNAEIGFADLESPSLGITAEDLSRITIPVLVLAGEVTHPSLRSVADRLAGALPDARFVELEGSGHVTYAERPDDFAEAVSVFAAELDRRTPLTSG
jgi:3-oxoadipate enol-lactonase